MKKLALHLLPSKLIRLSHTGCFALSDQILNNLRLEVEAKLFHEQRTAFQQVLGVKTEITPQLVNKLSHYNTKKMQTF